MKQAVDVFSKPPKLPRLVYIVGSGPLGERHWRRIPADAYVIACNKGGVIPQQYAVPWRVSLWMVADMFVTAEAWFNDVPPGVTRLFGNQLVERGFASQLRFDEEPWMHCGDVRPEYGKLRGGLTILGAALQLVYHFGCLSVEAVLCGFDLTGGARFGEEPGYREGHWDIYLLRLDSFINSCLRGRVRSLSPTALCSVPVLRDGV